MWKLINITVLDLFLGYFSISIKIACFDCFRGWMIDMYGPSMLKARDMV